ncbi:aspartate kinase [Jeotgalibacillus proteolyticus]|uniref:Aspartokinase n=1 Tax=Jeotgalibacillus proteolyticus TaxID=2082395 RepID=A0A2S5GF60_9BACL|nr:aspartate kinase [Jeotgalibacillus proteolyticus]PPA71578.1 aspartate kinase [Jeotgalibacillus proteolyticus]
MSLIVQKFGGTSVGSVEKIQHVATRVIQEVNKGNQVVVVVSAMGKTTDELIRLAAGITDKPNKRDMDMLLTTGEQMTISLLSMALQTKGYSSVSMTGWQAGIQTEAVHSKARITRIETARMKEELNRGKIVVVAGFQGMDSNHEITTLGRGGSDTTAVALAAALKASRCDIYTDVDGVYTSDPRYIKGSRKLEGISYDEMLELANLGAGVLHPRAVEFAKNNSIPLTVRSSMEETEGTLIEEVSNLEENLVVRGVAFEGEIVRVTIYGLQNEFTGLAAIFSTLADNHINVDIIIQSRTDINSTNLSFSIKEAELEDALAVLSQHKEELGFTRVEHETGLAKVSIVGSGMVSNPGVAAQMFQALSQNSIAIKMVSTSEIKVSTVVNMEDMLKAAQIIHDSFSLEALQPKPQLAK